MFLYKFSCFLSINFLMHPGFKQYAGENGTVATDHFCTFQEILKKKAFQFT